MQRAVAAGGDGLSRSRVAGCAEFRQAKFTLVQPSHSLPLVKRCLNIKRLCIITCEHHCLPELWFAMMCRISKFRMTEHKNLAGGVPNHCCIDIVSAKQPTRQEVGVGFHLPRPVGRHTVFELNNVSKFVGENDPKICIYKQRCKIVHVGDKVDVYTTSKVKSKQHCAISVIAEQNRWYIAEQNRWCRECVRCVAVIIK
jgi:hypothetical protein